jgi:lipopolysaccharide export system permease protein
VSKDVRSLVHSIDSVGMLAAEKSRQQSEDLYQKHYLGRENINPFIYPDKDTVFAALDVDSLYASFSVSDRQRALQHAIDQARRYKDLVQYNSILLDDYQRYMRKHAIELHRKFTLAFACLIFFFIGAPLGAIIRKGGLGAPIVISVALFIVYYIIDNAGYKMAREALWPVWEGMWLSSFVLLPIGVFLTYKATTDSALFNPEVWIREAEKIRDKLKKLYKENGQN